MTSERIRALLVPSTGVLAYGAYRLLRALADVMPQGISRLGTASGGVVARTARSGGYLWLKRHLPVAAAIYVLLVGLLISFGTLTTDAAVIGCPAVALAVSYLVNRFRPQS